MMSMQKNGMFSLNRIKSQILTTTILITYAVNKHGKKIHVNNLIKLA